MMNKTKLIIKRVVIRASSKIVYDENFHEGLNVIRGHNGTGKSTIMELISYGLGGDIKKNNWKREALDCSNITIELELNGKLFVFKRAIEGEASRPQIEMYEGGIDESMQPDARWEHYKNQKSDTRKSYSMRIFDLLGLEQHNTADSESLTMHQFLRILYVDQDTPASKIFRTEPFIYDKETMRKAIGEYAFGFDNLQAHALRQKLYDTNKKFEKLDAELKTIYQILGQTNIKATPQEIEHEIGELYTELNELVSNKTLDKSNSIFFENKEIAKQAAEIQKQIELQAALITELETEYVSTSYEISESVEFLESLDSRKQALSKAQVASQSIGGLGFKYCPSCFEEVEVNDADDHCCLCKTTSNSNKVNETYLQALNELDFQSAETKQMLESQQAHRATLAASIKNHKETTNHLRANFNEINSYTSDYEVELTKLANKKGFIEAQIENLKDRLSLAEDLDAKRKRKEGLQNTINDLELQLENLEAAKRSRTKAVRSKISEKVVDILAADGGVEPAFDQARKFEFDFATDSIRLDDRANFSASSNVVLKNAFHLATLLTAVEDREFRIPCFSMFDNIEDKGMREERSQVFQRTIANLTNELNSDFQVIMTTSMVDETLNNKQYGVGPYYKKGEHTLNM